MSTEELIQQLETQKRQLSETNGHLVTLRAILRVDSSADYDGNFIYSGGFVSTPGFNLMIRKLTEQGLSNRLPYPQGHILSHKQGLSAAEYRRRNENCFIVQIDYSASIRDNNQTNNMAKTKVQDRINDAVPLSAPYPIVAGNANLLRNRPNNVTMGSAIPDGDYQSHYSIASETPSQGTQVSQIYLLIHHRMF